MWSQGYEKTLSMTDALNQDMVNQVQKNERERIIMDAKSKVRRNTLSDRYAQAN